MSFAELSGVEPPFDNSGVNPELLNRSPFDLVGTTAADSVGAVGANSNRPEQRQQSGFAPTILPPATGGDDRRSWKGWMSDIPVWERLVRIPRSPRARRWFGQPHGWGPVGVSAAYRRRFGSSPPKNHRGHFVYSRAEIEAVAALLEAETSRKVAA